MAPLVRLALGWHLTPVLWYSYNGEHTAEAIVEFVREMTSNALVHLNSATFKREVLESDDLWVVDFYAPWCT